MVSKSAAAATKSDGAELEDELMKLMYGPSATPERSSQVVAATVKPSFTEVIAG